MVSLVLVVILVITSVVLYIDKCFRRPFQYPPGPQWWPFVGNSTQLRDLSRRLGGIHLAAAHWASMYNTPVLGLRLGGEDVVVIFTADVVREALCREEFDGRPNTFFIRMRTMGTRLGITCTEGRLWAEHRAFAVRHFRGVGYGKQLMADHIRGELRELLDVLQTTGPEVSFGRVVAPSVINVLWTFTAGKRILRESPQLNKLLTLLTERSKAFDMAGGTLNQMPWLRFIAPERTGYNLLVTLNQEFRALFTDTIRDHHDQHTPENREDLIYAFITEMKLKKGPGSTFTNEQLIMVILDIFIAGSQTTSNTLDFAFLMMVLRQDIQNKARQELQRVLDGKEPTLEDRQRLPYNEAILFEVQRFFHIITMTGPRRVTKDTTLAGFRIPKDTTVLLSLHSIHMDSEYWGDPEVFRPERFLDESGLLLPNERLIPFGLGRRRCLGEALAKACMFIFFVGVIQRFHLEVPSEMATPSAHPIPGITQAPRPYIAKITKVTTA